jgi:hypothetical protein
MVLHGMAVERLRSRKSGQGIQVLNPKFALR